ncbi:SDR family NAD(P)-dependent oxidoreductase [Enterococcus sp. HY326]|uniref:SDR family NAD(P)-dependent oxidoreductase n=1 Tax=Enterococcus sp. HY326 TaxID=2971265 RepID=UPI00223F4B72|nr:SDR family NAD(P)-dependent oxidoreductase [Enterococcus sp. HY326]
MIKKYTVITGASSGIGRSAAIKFAEEGKNLILAARNEAALKELKKELESKCQSSIIVKSVDLSKEQEVKEFWASLGDYQIETFVNNAGFGKKTTVEQMDLEDISEMIDLNIKALVYLSTKFVAQYRDVAGTTLVNVGSLAGYSIFNESVVYSASKFFVSAFTEGLAKELEVNKHLLKVKILAPGPVETNFEAVAKNVSTVNYQETFPQYHTADQMADFLLELVNSDKVLGKVNRDEMTFSLVDGIFEKIGFESSK